MRGTRDYARSETARASFEREYREYIRQHSRYDAECRRLKQRGYYGNDALRRALTVTAGTPAASNPCDNFQDRP